MSLLSRTLLRSYPAILYRNFHATSSTRNEELKRLLFSLDGYYMFGLLADDLLTERMRDVAEALRRLPEEEQMQRKYRAIRAAQAEINNSILPREQWTKYEDNHHYLQPYIEEVRKEREEREKWEANH